jgi:hypothetical protein
MHRDHQTKGLLLSFRMVFWWPQTASAKPKRVISHKRTPWGLRPHFSIAPSSTNSTSSPSPSMATKLYGSPLHNLHKRSVSSRLMALAADQATAGQATRRRRHLPSSTSAPLRDVAFASPPDAMMPNQWEPRRLECIPDEECQGLGRLGSSIAASRPISGCIIREQQHHPRRPSTTIWIISSLWSRSIATRATRCSNRTHFELRAPLSGRWDEGLRINCTKINEKWHNNQPYAAEEKEILQPLIDITINWRGGRPSERIQLIVMCRMCSKWSKTDHYWVFSSGCWMRRRRGCTQQM